MASAWISCASCASCVLAIAGALAGCGSDDSSPANATAASSGAGAGSSASGAGGGTGGSGGGTGGGMAAECFADISSPLTPNYDVSKPTIASHCFGTNHQDIAGVEKVVFLGDSITVGTPPTPSDQFYRTVLTGTLQAKFGMIDVQSCAENGARTDDLMPTQIPKCFPAPEPKKTLVIMTDGGNDEAAWAKDGLTAEQAMAESDKAVQLMREAIQWLKDPVNFPNGSFVVFGNVYDPTDGTGNLDACVGAQFIGLTGDHLEIASAVVHLEETYMQIAVDTKSDMTFMLEQFCGHGFHNDDPANPCYRGPDTPRWFDISCIHPTPEGHAMLAKMFQATVDE